MAYLVAADFRSATSKSWCQGNILDTADVADADLTALIASMSLRFDYLTDDHFESSGAGAIMTVDSIGGSELWVPKRIQAITKVETLYQPSTFVTENVAAYKFTAWTDDIRKVQKEDYVEVVPGIGLSGGMDWPNDRQSVRITGTFDWIACPDRVKAAVAVMVWDEVKTMGDYAQRATRLSTNDGIYEGFGSLPPKAATIVAEFCRQRVLIA